MLISCIKVNIDFNYAIQKRTMYVLCFSVPTFSWKYAKLIAKQWCKIKSYIAYNGPRLEAFLLTNPSVFLFCFFLVLRKDTDVL